MIQSESSILTKFSVASHVQSFDKFFLAKNRMSGKKAENK